MKQSKLSQLMLLLLMTPGAVTWAASNENSNSKVLLSQQADKITTKGVVVDAKGEPLIGVSILEK